MKSNNPIHASVALLMTTTLSIACHQPQGPEGGGPGTNDHVKERSGHAHHDHAFADKASVEKMARHFEAPERDSMQRPEQVLEFLGDLQGRTVMDIGAGTGYFTVRIARQGARVIAADVSDEFQRYLAERIERDGLSNVELRKVQYDDPDLADAEADIVFVANTYHHMEQRTAYFAKVRRGLKPDGSVVVVDYFQAELPKTITAPPTKLRVSVDQVVFELKAAGFTVFEVDVNALPYQYMIKAR